MSSTCQHLARILAKANHYKTWVTRFWLPSPCENGEWFSPHQLELDERILVFILFRAMASLLLLYGGKF